MITFKRQSSKAIGMKIVVALSLCVSLAGTAIAQKTAAPSDQKDPKAAAAAKPPKGNSVFGTIRNARNKAVKGVEAYVYTADSTIVASGLTDTGGHYSTNSFPAGNYYVKLVYPPSRKFVIVYNIQIKPEKQGPVILDLRADVPEADTMFSYDFVKPKLAKDDKKKK